MLTTILLYFVLGACAGTIAGVFGVGGGVIIVPALIFMFSFLGMSPDILTHLAVGTSLAVICVSSVNSVISHHRNGFVLWDIVKWMSPGLMLGVVVGVYTIVNIPGQQLQFVIGSFLLLIAMQMGFQLMPASSRQLPVDARLLPAGGVIGWVSALFGIGGGSLTVPFLSYFGTQMQKAVATSAACGMPIAFVGAISNIIAGSDVAARPEMSLGFIYLPAFFGIALMSAPFAHVGAHLAKRLPAKQLKQSFALFVAMIGCWLITQSLGII